MKYIVAFVAGVVVGAVAAMLLAPASGEELRTKIRDQAQASLKHEAADTVEEEPAAAA